MLLVVAEGVVEVLEEVAVGTLVADLEEVGAVVVAVAVGTLVVVLVVVAVLEDVDMATNPALLHLVCNLSSLT